MAKPPENLAPYIWEGGRSGNPSGGPKGGLKRLARQHAREVLEKLLAIIAATPATGPSQAQMSAFALFLDFFDWAPPSRAKAAEPPPAMPSKPERRAAQQKGK